MDTSDGVPSNRRFPANRLPYPPSHFPGAERKHPRLPPPRTRVTKDPSLSRLLLPIMSLLSPFNHCVVLSRRPRPVHPLFSPQTPNDQRSHPDGHCPVPPGFSVSAEKCCFPLSYRGVITPQRSSPGPILSQVSHGPYSAVAQWIVPCPTIGEVSGSNPDKGRFFVENSRKFEFGLATNSIASGTYPA